MKKYHSIYLLSILASILAACSSGSPSTLAVQQQNTTITGRVSLGPVDGGVVNIYPTKADGSPDTSNLLGTATTDANGTYTVNIPQSQLSTLGTNPTVVAQLEAGHGTYTEEATGTQATVTAALLTALPINGNNATGSTVTAAITPLTTIATNNAIITTQKAILTQALADPTIAASMPQAMQDQAKAFLAGGATPDFLSGNSVGPTANLAAYNSVVANPAFSTTAFQGQKQQNVSNAVFAVGQSFGFPTGSNIVSTLPPLPTQGGTNQADTTYNLALAGISQQAKQSGNDVTSIGVMQALSQQFAANGSFTAPTGPATAPITVIGANGQSITIAPPSFSAISAAVAGIANGSIQMPSGFQVTSPASSSSPGSTGVTPGAPGAGVPPGGFTFVPPTLTGTPSFTPPSGFGTALGGTANQPPAAAGNIPSIPPSGTGGSNPTATPSGSGTGSAPSVPSTPSAPSGGSAPSTPPAPPSGGGAPPASSIG